MIKRIISLVALLSGFMALVLVFISSSSAEVRKQDYFYASENISRLSSAAPTGFWAHVRYAAKVRSEPSFRSRNIGRLHFFTEDGFPETYAVYRSRDSEEGIWYRIGIPARPNGQKGWVPESALGKVHPSYRELRISRKHFVAKLWERRPGGGKKLVWKARVGVGAPGTETPGGRFWIRERIKGFSSGTIYGYMAFGTSAYSKLSDWPGGGVVGIHGTDEPSLIPGAISHGCIRVRNKKIRKLSRLLGVGAPVRIF